MDAFLHADAWITLATLTLLEIVLGIDNIVFLSIMAGKLPAHQQSRARRLGLALALIMRLGLLLCLSWAMHLTEPLFEIVRPFSGRDLILFFGGLFLLGKSTHEIYGSLEGEDGDVASRSPRRVSFSLVLLQIAILDIVFSLDSVITAVGMAQELSIMVIAMVIAVGVMIFFANPIGDFVEKHPSMKVLALAFLILIGTMLMAEGLGQHMNKGYIYSAMAFSLLVELLNMRLRKKKQPVHLHGPLAARHSQPPPAPTTETGGLG
jgi:predicted tellurium resistance membrane protein TerC